MIPKFSVKRPYTVIVGIILAIVLGVVSLTRLSTDLLPDMNLPYAIVMTTYVGASPDTVETAVTIPLEESMATVSGIDNISSTSNENYSLVILEFQEGTNMDSATVEMREKLDQLESRWNDDAISSPLIMKINPDMAPILVAAVDMDGKDQKQLTDFVDSNLIAKLESMGGVASVSAAGEIEAEIQVVVRQDKIDALNEKISGLLDDTFADAQDKLDEGADKLKDGKKELDSQKENLANQLAEGENQVVDGKITAISSKLQLQQQISLLKAALDEAEKGLKAVDEAEANNAQTEAAIQSLEELEAKALELEATKAAAQLELEGLRNLPQQDEQPAPSQPEQQPLEQPSEQPTEQPSEQPSEQPETPSEEQPEQQPSSPASDNVEAEMARLEAVISTSDKGLDAMRTALGKQGIPIQDSESVSLVVGQRLVQMRAASEAMDVVIENKEELRKTVDQIRPAYEQMTAAMEQIETGETALSDALTTINSSGILASIELGSATAQIASAEAQMDSAQAQLDSARDSAYDAADADTILSVNTVVGLLTAQNFEMPAGYITQGEDSLLVRVGQKIQTLDELKALPLLDLGMDGLDTIRLDDVADVIVQDNSKEVYAKVNGNGALILSILKQDGYSTGDVTKQVLARFDQLSEEYPGLHFSVLSDQGVYIDMVIHSVMQSMAYGAVLAVVVLFLFLKDLRPTMIIAVSIPVSAVLALVFMYMAGVSINMMSLGGLSLGIGMLVDNSVVVLENIYRYRAQGYNIWSAAVAGTKEVLGAIVASTLTTVCVFTGLFFTEGIVIDMLIALALSFTFALLGSLIIAMTFVPMMSSMLMGKSKDIQHPWFDRFANGYGKLLALCLRFKPVVILLAVVLAAATSYATLTRGFTFMPEMASTQASVSLTTPVELTFEETMEIADQVAERLLTIPDVETVGVQAGGGGMMGTLVGSMFGGGGSGEEDNNSASFYVVFSEERTLSNEEFTQQALDKCADLNCELDVSANSMDLSALSGNGITVQVYGRDKEELEQQVIAIADQLKDIKGVSTVETGLSETGNQLKVTVDKEKAAEHSLTVAQVFQTIAGKIATPTSITTLELEEGSFALYVKKDSDQDMTRDELGQIDLTASNSTSAMGAMGGASAFGGGSTGGLGSMTSGFSFGDDEEDKEEEKETEEEKITLSDVAEITDAVGMDVINRYNQQRYLSITAFLEDDANPTLVSGDIQDTLSRYPFPDGIYVDYSGESETIMEAMLKLVEMLLLALVCIYLIMVAQFQSLLHPFIIMFTIPLAFTGGFIALLIADSEISVISMIGFVLLSGVIVNNGIVMIDYINQLRQRGMEKREAILEAGRTRLRPVLMTTLTTVFAQTFMALGDSMDAALLKPMALVTVGGLTYGTLMTLLFVPCIYDVFTSNKPMKEMEIDDSLLE